MKCKWIVSACVLAMTLLVLLASACAPARIAATG